MLTNGLTVSLPADFTVWIASKEADFLRGRFVYWYVVEVGGLCTND